MSSRKICPASHSHLFIRGTALVVYAAIGFVGCDLSSRLPAAQQLAPASATSFENGKVAQCPNACVQKSLPIILATLGFDPELDCPEGTTGLQQFARDFQRHAGPGQGEINSVSFSDCLDRVVASSSALGVLLDRSGHLYLLLGAVQVDRHTVYQVVHGDARVALLSKAEIPESNIVEAWVVEGNGARVPIRVEEGTLSLDKVYHNFGEIMPGNELQCVFTVANESETALVIDPVNTSCGCTSTSVDGPLVIAPSEQASMQVNISPTNVESVRQYVTFTVRNPESGASRDVLLTLVGSQCLMKDVVPASINFGLVSPDSSS